MGRSKEGAVAAQIHARPTRRRRRGPLLAIAILDAVAIDQERDAVDERVQEEGDRTEGREQERRESRSRHRTRQASRPRIGPPPCPGAPRSLRWRGRCSRGWTGRSRRSTRPRAVGSHPGSDMFVVRPGEDHGDRAEDRAEQHHPVVAEPVRQHAEERRQDELREIERVEWSRASVVGCDHRTAVLGQLCQVDAEHRPREAGRETEGEGAGHHGPHRSVHHGKRSGFLRAQGARPVSGRGAAVSSVEHRGLRRKQWPTSPS